jgi:hypothetical protein
VIGGYFPVDGSYIFRMTSGAARAVTISLTVDSIPP